jgi:hypothetical protein
MIQTSGLLYLLGRVQRGARFPANLGEIPLPCIWKPVRGVLVDLVDPGNVCGLDPECEGAKKPHEDDTADEHCP